MRSAAALLFVLGALAASVPSAAAARLPCPLEPLTDHCPAWTDLYDHPGGHGDGLGADVGVVAIASPEGDRTFVGGYSADDASGLDGLLMATDPITGQRLWVHRHDGPDGANDSVRALALSRDGERLYAVGTQNASGGVAADFLITALDAATGEPLWAAGHDNGGVDFGQGIAVGPPHEDDERPGADRVYVTGQSEGEGMDGTTLALDGLTGQTVWTHRFAEAGGFVPFDSMYAIAVEPSGERVVAIGDTYNETTSRFDAIAVALDAGIRGEAGGGDERWRSSRANASGYRIGFAADGSRVVWAGIARRTGGVSWGLPATDYLTVSLDAADGAPAWERTWSGFGANGGENAVSDLAVTADRVYVTGLASGLAEGDDDYGTVAYDADTGEELWTSRYGGPGHLGDAATALAVSGDRVYVTGVSAPAFERPLLISNQFTTLPVSAETPRADAATIALDAADGTRLWTARLNGSAEGEEASFGYDIAATDGRVMIAGWTGRPADRADDDPTDARANRYDLLTAAYSTG